MGTNTELEGLLFEYDLDGDIPARGSLAKTSHALKEFATRHPSHEVMTDFGPRPLRDVVVDEAIARVPWNSKTDALWQKLERYLSLDGFALLREPAKAWGADFPTITGRTLTMPIFVELPQADSELEALLARFNMTVAARHLQSAKENVVQGDWEAANAQSRTFLEALTNAIADGLYGTEAVARSSGLQKRQLLAEKGFLLKEKHEFGDGQGQSFLPGLAKMLHTDGSHPGTSTHYDALFRLQLVVVTGRWLLKRLEQWKA